MGHRFSVSQSQRYVLLCVAASLYFTCIGEIPTAMAAPITPLQARLVYESTVVDSDFDLLGLFFGFPVGQQATYQSTNSPVQSSGMLAGTPLGAPLSVTYLANFSGFPPGPTTWTSNGFYGSNAWSGSGNFTIVNSTPTGFDADINSTLTVGGSATAPPVGSAQIAARIHGVIDGSQITYTGTTGLLTGTTNGDAFASANIAFSLSGVYTGLFSDVSNGFAVPGLPSGAIDRGATTDANVLCTESGVCTLIESIAITAITPAIPEPASLLLLGSGLVGVAAAVRTRRPRRSFAAQNFS